MIRNLAIVLFMTGVEMKAAPLDAKTAARFAQLALDCVHREYPNKIAHSLNSDKDVHPPRVLTPAFYGCFDWHSSVHGHWLLARAARTFPAAPFAAKAKAALAQSLTAENLKAEAAYLNGAGRISFERPYGLAWLLQLAAELRAWPEAKPWSHNLEPVEEAAVKRIETWIVKLPYPVRSGEHSNTAFGLGLMLDYARDAGNKPFRTLLESRARSFYANDSACPFSYEPSGEDFLSPCLAEADVMRRVLPASEFQKWLARFLPSGKFPLTPAVSPDPTDGKLAHLDGLNLSRAWMLKNIAAQLPAGPRKTELAASSEAHAQAGLRAVTGEHYEGGHWLGSFAIYLLTP